jgi:hypothetical protein
MSADTLDIRALIQKLAKTDDEIYSLVCTVKEVNGDFCSVAPVNGDAEIFKVKLVAGSSKTPLLIEPVVDSVVVVTFLSKNTAFISLYSEIESVQIRGDQYGGLIKIEELVKKINALENQVNDLYNALIGIVVPLAPSGAYPLAPSFAAIQPIAPTTQKSDLENDKIKHG